MQQLSRSISSSAFLKSIVFLSVFVLLVRCTEAPETKLPQQQTLATAPAPDKGIWQLSSVASPYLAFRNGQKLNTKLHDVQYIGQLPVPGDQPYLLYSGRYCGNCEARQMLYLSQPRQMPLETDSGKSRLMHPGLMRDLETGEILYKARTFYGTVLNNTNGVIWYQESLSDYNSYIPNIFLISINERGRTDTTFAYSDSYLQQTLQLLQKGACTEVKGIEYQSEP